jgi:hypothetical protein
MLRALVALLLVANGLLLATLLGAFQGLLPAGNPPEREPERLARQIRPEAVRLTPGGPVAAPAGAGPAATGASSAANPAASAAGPTPAPASAPPSGLAAAAGPALAPAAGAAATAAAGPLACLQAGPYDTAQLAQAGRVMRAAGLADGVWQSVALPPARSWLVVMGPYPERQQLTRKEAELRRRNVEFTTLAASPELPAGVAPGLSLGRYDTEAAAEAALDRLAARGVRSARVVERAPVGNRALLRVPAADAAQQAVLGQLALPAGLRWGACPEGAAAPVNGRR